MRINPILAIDSYKLGHITMYPDSISRTYLNLTPRSIKYLERLIPSDFKYDNKIVAFGIEMAIKDIIDSFNQEFFQKPLDQVIQVFSDIVAPFLGESEDINKKVTEEIIKLYSYGHLPLVIKALPEGSLIPVQTPVLTITQSVNDLPWLAGFLETYISQNTWKTMTTATVARIYRKILEHFSELTCDNNDHLDWQGHDFADRGMSGTEDAIKAGISHLTQFKGTDSVHSVYTAKYHYGFKSPFFGASVPATEHSIMQLGIKEVSEKDTISRLIKQFPSGILSVVCDTEDYWNTLTNILPSLKDEILARTPNSLGLAKFVVRPDSGDPVDVICGVPYCKDSDTIYPEWKGSIEILWDTFGGTINAKGYKVLNPKIGLIYGDSITPQRAYEICKKLEAKGFASSNVVFGIGSYAYNYHTRDTLGLAIKCTAAWDTDGNLIEVQKLVKTDSGKKSAKGLLHVDSNFKTTDSATLEQEASGELKVIYANSTLYLETDFETIRTRAQKWQ